jgi:NAD(P)-dependent dehydrogenase (short-subunit alcohol dehydrogenase family)
MGELDERPDADVAIATAPAIVSGGAGGIGRTIACELAVRGSAVTIVDLQDATATVAQIAARGGSVHAITCDVADPAAAAQAVERAERQHGTCQILVNAAGVSPSRRVPFLEADLGDWNRTLAVNAGGVFNLSQAVAARIVERRIRPGRIVNVLSTASFMGFAGMSAYCASKGAALLLTKTLAIELASHGITVNGVAPGSIETPMTGAFRADSPPAQAAAISAHDLSRTVLRARGRPRDVAAAVVFLTGTDANWITGSVVVVDGGFMATGAPAFDAAGQLVGEASGWA